MLWGFRIIYYLVLQISLDIITLGVIYWIYQKWTSKCKKSGGYGSIILFRSADKAFFVYGFSKSNRDNIRKDELTGFRALADEMSGYNEATLTRSLKSGAIVEVKCDEKTVSK